MSSEIKVCTSCQTGKGLESFYADKSKSDGRQSRCKSCNDDATRTRRANNPEVARAVRRRSYRKNREHALAYFRNYYRENPDAAKIRGQRYRANKLAADCGCISVITLTQRMIALGDACIYCGGPFEEVDHYFPLSRGGLHCLSNIVPACKRCNASKKDTEPGSKWMPRVHVSSLSNKSCLSKETNA